MARSTYFDLSRSADACLGSESGYAQRFQCGNVVKPLIWTGMIRPPDDSRPFCIAQLLVTRVQGDFELAGNVFRSNRPFLSGSDLLDKPSGGFSCFFI